MPCSCARRARRSPRRTTQGIVHRDIKPANFFVAHAGDEYDFVKLLDFGVARVVEGEQPLAHRDRDPLRDAGVHVARGLRGRARVRRASDIYSLGAVLYFMLTGTQLFPDRTFAETVMSHISRTPEPPSVRLGEPLPQGLEAGGHALPPEEARGPLP